MKRALSSLIAAIPPWICVGVLICASAQVFAGPGGGAEPASIPDTVAMQKEVDALEHAFTNTFRKLEQHGASKSSATSEVVWWIAGIGLLGALILVKYFPALLEIRDTSYQAKLAAAKAAVEVHPQMAAEEKAFEVFAERFNSGPLRSNAEAEPEAAENGEPRWTEQGKQRVSPERETLSPPREIQPYRDESQPALTTKENEITIETSDDRKPSKRLPALRRLVSELSRAGDETEKQKALARLSAEVEAFKSYADAPEWVPAWKVGSALEALLKQLAGKVQSVNPSTLRTTSAAVDLLETLCRPGIRPDLVQQPPIRILAVDDDPISRHAISFTLKKTLCLPELASEGATALELATQNAYDAMFLDIQMPGLDGFELCAKIRETELNRTTPVVFVTCHTDFNSRASSSRVGGQDLIGKPFLTFELGLKALTLVLQRRLSQEKIAAAQPDTEKTEQAELAALAK